MDTSKITDFLQLLSSIGVLVGLLIVAYELRQNQTIAEAEHSRAVYGMFMQAAGIEMGENIGEVVIKSFDDPANLSKHEKFRLNAWFVYYLSIYDSSDRASELGVTIPGARMSDAEARFMFSSDYSRQWFKANRYWIRPANAETIARVIDSTSVSTEWVPISIEDFSAPSKHE